MALNQRMVEEIGAWCPQNLKLAAEREEARQLFSAEYDLQVRHWTELFGRCLR